MRDFLKPTKEKWLLFILILTFSGIPGLLVIFHSLFIPFGPGVLILFYLLSLLGMTPGVTISVDDFYRTAIILGLFLNMIYYYLVASFVTFLLRKFTKFSFVLPWSWWFLFLLVFLGFMIAFSIRPSLPFYLLAFLDRLF